MNLVLYVLSGLVAGILAGYFLFRSLRSNALNLHREKIEALGLQLADLKSEEAKSREEILRLTRENSFQKAENQSLEKRLQEQKEEILRMNEKLNLEFKNLANEILEEKTKKFTVQNKENLDLILKPLSERIKEFEKKVDETYDKEAQQRFSLKEEVKKLADLNQKVSEEAGNLTRALKGETKTQGNWGEMILESILEKSGLVKEREYRIQPALRDEEGNLARPDIVVEYPAERFVIIDSKVSLVHYERYVSSEDPDEKEKLIAEHLQSVKNHILNLSRKNYQDLYDVKSLDFVMLFMPVEPAYLLAIQQDHELWNYAYEKRILLMSPTNLIAALKMISSLWRQEQQNRNAKEIAKRSSDLLEKFYGLLSDLEDLGNKLNSTRKTYDEAIKKISTGKGNLIKRAEDIRKLGASPGKSIPAGFLERLKEEDETEEEDETMASGK
jgi:DNA recombination protein RmuC